MKETARTDRELAGAYNRLGLALLQLGDPDSALTCFEEHLSLAKRLGDRERPGVALTNLATAYQAMGDYRKALRYYEDALNFKQYQRDQAVILHNIGCVYFRKGRYREALRYYRKALKLSEEARDDHSVAHTMLEVGSLFIRAKRFSMARKFLEEGFRRVQELEDIHWQFIALLYLTDLEIAQKNYARALETCCQGYTFAKAHEYRTLHLELRPKKNLP